jgi:hypothetical protein
VAETFAEGVVLAGLPLPAETAGLFADDPHPAAAAARATIAAPNLIGAEAALTYFMAPAS